MALSGTCFAASETRRVTAVRGYPGCELLVKFPVRFLAESHSNSQPRASRPVGCAFLSRIARCISQAADRLSNRVRPGVMAPQWLPASFLGAWTVGLGVYSQSIVGVMKGFPFNPTTTTRTPGRAERE